MKLALDTTKQPTAPIPSGVAANGVQISTDKKEPDASRGMGQTLAKFGGQATAMGMDVAQKGANVLANAVATGAEDKARHLFKASVLNRVVELYAWMNMLPFGGNVFSAVVSNFFFPYYKQINPESKITADEILHSLKHGHTDSLENEVFETFDKFISSNLKGDEKSRYENGDKMVVFNAFKNLLVSQVSTAREPGGIKKICNGIANWIPLINKLPAAVKPWAGGAIGALVIYKVAKIAWYMAKKALWLAGGILGIKFLVNKFGGAAGAPPGLPSMPAMPSLGHGGGHGEEEAPQGGGGMMDKLMKGVSKAAEFAAQAQGGGHGAPGGGGGLAQALSALAGAGGGGGH